MSAHLGAWAWFAPGALLALAGMGAAAWRFAARITRWSDAVNANTKVTNRLAKCVRKQTRKIGWLEGRLGELDRRVGDLERRS